MAQIVSHLQHDAQNAVSLVNKQFREVVTTPYVWFLAFARQFPGTLAPYARSDPSNLWSESPELHVTYQRRFFPRLTTSASWRSEYIFRTRLLKDLAHGKPSVNSSSTAAHVRESTGKKVTASLTYWPEVDQCLTHLEVQYSDSKLSRVIHGASGNGRVTLSDPSTGKVEKWAKRDLTLLNNVDQTWPGSSMFGLGSHRSDPVLVPNCMDLSVPFGRIGGEGIPGGHAYYISMQVNNQRVENHETHYLASGHFFQQPPGIPKILDHEHGVSAVWIAKSSHVPAATQSVVGMLTGSTCGVVTAYSLASEGSKSKGALDGCMTAKWVLSPGVPIVSFKIDDNYSVKRRNANRVWAVALNALGEVYYLKGVPDSTLQDVPGKNADQIHEMAWISGRSVTWHLLEQTRRVAQAGSDEVAADDGSPVLSDGDAAASSSQDDADHVSQLCRLKPAHFRRVYEGWDMQRKVEVDFAADDGCNAGESLFVINSGDEHGSAASIRRYTRGKTNVDEGLPIADEPPTRAAVSIFGATMDEKTKPVIAVPAVVKPTSAEQEPLRGASDRWAVGSLDLVGHASSRLTTISLDNSLPSQLTLSEDNLYQANALSNREPSGPTEEPGRAALDSIPGRRGRFLIAGTSNGALLVWNSRGDVREGERLHPLRVIQTNSPSITAAAASALFVIHGGSDGVAQIWDPFSSTLEPVKTVNAKHHHRVPRRLMTLMAGNPQKDWHAINAIALDPDPLRLRGCLTTGLFVRSWSFGTQRKTTKAKRRSRHGNGRVSTRRTGAAFTGFIAVEEAAMQKERKERERELQRLRTRFGLGELSEAEAVQYAQMLSQEHEQHVASSLSEHERARFEQLVAQDDASVSASGDAQSSSSNADVGTSSTSSATIDGVNNVTADRVRDTGFEADMQRALRLSLLESSHDIPVPEVQSNDYPVTIKTKRGKKAKRANSSSGSSGVGESSRLAKSDADDLALALGLSLDEQANSSAASHAGPSSAVSHRDGYSVSAATQDDDLALALRLSMQDQAATQSLDVADDFNDVEFPPLVANDVSPKGKGKGLSSRRW